MGGQLYLPKKGFTLGRAYNEQPDAPPAWPRVIQYFDAPALSAALGTALQPAALALDSNHPAAFARIWQAYTMTATRHYAYAAQWWGLAITLIVFGIIWRRQSTRSTGGRDSRLRARPMKRGRLKLVVIFAVFLGPLLAAFVWYYGLGGVFALRGSTNNAPLISPVIALKPFSNAEINGAPFTAESLKHRWSVIHTVAERCDRHCEKSLYNTRQTRLALGKDANRLRRILLGPNREVLNRLAADHPDAVRLLESGDDSRSGLENQLAPRPQKPQPRRA